MTEGNDGNVEFTERHCGRSTAWGFRDFFKQEGEEETKDPRKRQEIKRRRVIEGTRKYLVKESKESRGGKPRSDETDERGRGCRAERRVKVLLRKQGSPPAMSKGGRTKTLLRTSTRVTQESRKEHKMIG